MLHERDAHAGARLQRLLPDARRIVLPYSGHTPMLEHSFSITNILTRAGILPFSSASNGAHTATTARSVLVRDAQLASQAGDTAGAQRLMGEPLATAKHAVASQDISGSISALLQPQALAASNGSATASTSSAVPTASNGAASSGATDRSIASKRAASAGMAAHTGGPAQNGAARTSTSETSNGGLPRNGAASAQASQKRGEIMRTVKNRVAVAC